MADSSRCLERQQQEEGDQRRWTHTANTAMTDLQFRLIDG